MEDDDRRAAGRLGDAKPLEHGGLALCRGAAVAAHSRDDRRPRPQLLQPPAHGLNDGDEPVDAPAAHPDGHAVAGTDAATRQDGIELAVHRFVDILNLPRVEMHSHPKKLRKIEIGLDERGIAHDPPPSAAAVTNPPA